MPYEEAPCPDDPATLTVLPGGSSAYSPTDEHRRLVVLLKLNETPHDRISGVLGISHHEARSIGSPTKHPKPIPASARTASARHHRSARRHRPRRDIGAQDAAARMGRGLERIAVPSVGLTFPASLMALVVDRHQRRPLRCRRHRLTAPNPQQLAMAFDPELVAMRQLQRAQPRQDLIPRPPLRLRAIRPRRRGSGAGRRHDGDPGRNDLRQGAPAQWHQSGSVVGQDLVFRTG